MKSEGTPQRPPMQLQQMGTPAGGVRFEGSDRFVPSRLNSSQQAALVQLQAQTSAVPPGSSLSEFVSTIEEYTPTIPDAVTLQYMEKAGLHTSDNRVVRLISLATQKYVSDILLDALLQARMRGLGIVKKGSKEVKFTLTDEILEPLMKEYGIELIRPPYHS